MVVVTLEECVVFARDGFRWFCSTKSRPVSVAVILVFGAIKLHIYLSKRSRRKKWATAGRDVVVLHGFPRERFSPGTSPYVLKLETYLRLAKIPYVMDFTEPLGPKGLSPWITLNGEEFADSQLVIEHLGRQYNKDFSSGLTEVQRAVARTFNIMACEHLAWGLRFWRYSVDCCRGLIQSTSQVSLFLRLALFFLRWKVLKALWIQGTGRHTQKEVEHMVRQDLAAISHYLGEKPFLMGMEPCEVDCTMFGFLTQIMYNYPGSPYITMLIDDFPNLQMYQFRLRDLLWPDWNECLNPPK
ncbi:failed axon connections homolog [Panulirus ornatus]|uniref:failed axon connections homolog n=1 Tax=Panulirus ornatus TaxID=150431 RepID=UPI003A8B872B